MRYAAMHLNNSLNVIVEVRKLSCWKVIVIDVIQSERERKIDRRKNSTLFFCSQNEKCIELIYFMYLMNRLLNVISGVQCPLNWNRRWIYRCQTGEKSLSQKEPVPLQETLQHGSKMDYRPIKAAQMNWKNAHDLLLTLKLATAQFNPNGMLSVKIRRCYISLKCVSWLEQPSAAFRVEHCQTNMAVDTL